MIDVVEASADVCFDDPFRAVPVVFKLVEGRVAGAFRSEAMRVCHENERSARSELCFDKNWRG